MVSGIPKNHNTYVITQIANNTWFQRIIQLNCDCSAQQTPVEWMDHIQRFNDLVVRLDEWIELVRWDSIPFQSLFLLYSITISLFVFKNERVNGYGLTLMPQ